MEGCSQRVVRETARIREDIHRVLKGKQEVDRETQGGLGKVRGALHSNAGGRKLQAAGRPADWSDQSVPP